MKLKKRFICNECGYISPSWIGKCPECLNWNSIVEEIIEKQKTGLSSVSAKPVVNINDIEISNQLTYQTNNQSVNFFFGDGIVAGSVILITGDPGVGKSTFLLYLSSILKKDMKIFYFSGEESQEQIKRRCNRVELGNAEIFISNETEIDKISAICEKNKPDLVFLDSIQTCYSHKIDSSNGTVSQIKMCTSRIIQYAKSSNIPVIVVGHVTKSGDIAGPKIMEHMVDVVIYFEADYQYQYRLLRSTKNRFGSIDEILLFEMKETGLSIVNNPGAYFIDTNDKKNIIGKCRTIIMEGRRPLIVEVEALVVATAYSNPRRFAEGIELSRLNRITAILEKHINERLNTYDIYFNITGGIKTKDVGIDLAIAAAIYSSKKKLEINNENIILGELSLTGKIREIKNIEQRIKESKKFGTKTIILPKNSIKDNELELIPVNYIQSALKECFIKS